MSVPDPAPSERCRLRTTLYVYTLLVGEDPSRELLAYHWHPAIGPRMPHLHVYLASHPALPKFPRHHFPTSRVALEDVLALLLDKNEVRMTPRRADWRTVLRRTKAGFLRGRSWDAEPPANL